MVTKASETLALELRRSATHLQPVALRGLEEHRVVVWFFIQFRPLDVPQPQINVTEEPGFHGWPAPSPDVQHGERAVAGEMTENTVPEAL
jgi:hypothetical protein